MGLGRVPPAARRVSSSSWRLSSSSLPDDPLRRGPGGPMSSEQLDAVVVGDGPASGSGDAPAPSSAVLPADDWVVELHFDEVDSTQNYVEREHPSFDQSRLTAVSADFQTAGRGTRDRQWEAVRGQSVLVTFFFRFPEDCSTAFCNRNAPNVTKVVSVAAVDALRRAASERLPDDVAGALKFGMKWPNDVVVNGRKIAGVLARAVLSPKGRLDAVVVGVGININQTQSELDLISRPVWPATSLRAIAGDPEAVPAFDVAAVRGAFVRGFAREMRTFFAGGFPAFRERVNELEVHMGKPIRFRVSDNEVVDGTFAGVDEEGLIQLRLPSGAVKAYPSGEIVPRDDVAGAE